MAEQQIAGPPFSGAAESLDPSRVVAWRDFLQQAGAFSGDGTFINVQYDLNATWRMIGEQMVGASWCNKNCTDELGNYVCDAAVSLNRGIRPRAITPAEVVVGGLAKLDAGIDIARQQFFDGPFQAYCVAYRIPPEVAAAMRLALDQPGGDYNWFGGNPELNHGVTTANRAARARGHRTTLTTTGGRFLREPAFVQEIIADPPSLVALSADDFDGPADIRRLARLSRDELRAELTMVDSRHGQRQKAYEAIYTAQLAATTEGFPPVMFNMVLHDGNVGQAHEIIAALHEAFPGARINPFPAQSAFHYSARPAIRPENAGQVCAFVDYMIAAHTDALQADRPIETFVPRLHYWLMLRAVFDWAGDNTEQAMHMLAGNGIWQCYRDPAAGTYLQVGLGPLGQQRTPGVHFAGEHPGCFWNRRTVTEDWQISDDAITAADVAQHIQAGKSAGAAVSSRPCPGCAFPRLTSHIVATETGMDPRILPYYLTRRVATLGF